MHPAHQKVSGAPATGANTVFPRDNISAASAAAASGRKAEMNWAEDLGSLGIAPATTDQNVGGFKKMRNEMNW